jgi:hypothetical protein
MFLNKKKHAKELRGIFHFNKTLSLSFFNSKIKHSFQKKNKMSKAEQVTLFDPRLKSRAKGNRVMRHKKEKRTAKSGLTQKVLNKDTSRYVWIVRENDYESLFATRVDTKETPDWERRFADATVMHYMEILSDPGITIEDHIIKGSRVSSREHQSSDSEEEDTCKEPGCVLSSLEPIESACPACKVTDVKQTACYCCMNICCMECHEHDPSTTDAKVWCTECAWGWDEETKTCWHPKNSKESTPE